MTTLLNQTDGRSDELALIRSEPISMQWTNELRKKVGLFGLSAGGAFALVHQPLG
jgi:hypothetical protein